MIMFTFVFFFSGFLLSMSVGIEWKNENIILQSIVNEIETMKTTHRYETEQLKTSLLALQKENKELTTKVEQLLQEKVSHKKIFDGAEDGKEEVVNADHDVVPNLVKQSTDQMHSGKLRLPKRQVLADGRVAFTAVLSNRIFSLGGHQTVIFSEVVTNVGNSYHPNSGIFIAPYKGAYVFSVKMKVPPRHKLHLELVVDGKVAFDLGIEIPNSVDYESANEEFIIEVNQGANVFVRSTTTGGQLYGYRRSVFTGFLLFEME